MPFKVVKRGNKWCCVSPNRTLGCHSSRTEAEAQKSAVERSYYGKTKGKRPHGSGVFTEADLARGYKILT